MIKVTLASFMLFSLIGLAGPNSAQPAPIQSSVTPTQLSEAYEADLELAERYVPVFYFHPDEIYLPQPVDIVMGISRLRQSKRMWFDTTILSSFTAQDLFALPSDSNWFLDQWFGDTGSSEYGNYPAHQAIYESTLSPKFGGPEPTAYAHVVRNENPQYITIQYWVFYFYQDWFNKHEGDWEMVEVILTADEMPAWAVYSQHHDGGRRSWETTPVEEGTHPVVYVARDSHANYFTGDEVYPYDRDIGSKQLVLIDRTGSTGRLVPKLTLIPTRFELLANPGIWPGAQWLMFRGRWGETAVYGDFNGPYGPADKGAQWEQPYTWGIDQPLDGEKWYENRLRVEITGTAQAKAQVWLINAAGQEISRSESIDNYAILHTDPPEKILAQVEGPPGTRGDISVDWPDRPNKAVTRTYFSGFVLDASGHAQLELSAGQVVLVTAGNRLILPSRLIETYPAIWDAPDSVINTLPIHEILAGLFICLLISLIPVVFLVAILYWIDRYHKGPVRLLFVAFFWGAIPALIIAFSVQLFFKIPPSLMGPYALEVIRLGILAPVLEEVLKAAGVLFIFWRFRKEINDVLDGMIYGAIVGFGFAFISNLFRYAGDFISLGFPALNLNYLAVRTVHVLNHGLYTAIFGACLGFALLAKNRLRFWSWIMTGLILAIATHALQNLLSNSLVGLNVFTVIVTSAGTLVLWVVAGWSLVKQRRLLRQELQGVVHDSLYASIQDPLARARAQWITLRRHGFRTWLQLRRLQGLCIKLANIRLQARLHPDKFTGTLEVDTLQAEIARVFAAMHTAAS